MKKKVTSVFAGMVNYLSPNPQIHSCHQNGSNVASRTKVAETSIINPAKQKFRYSSKRSTNYRGDVVEAKRFTSATKASVSRSKSTGGTGARIGRNASTPVELHSHPSQRRTHSETTEFLTFRKRLAIYRI